jgi:hypothetical protein
MGITHTRKLSICSRALFAELEREYNRKMQDIQAGIDRYLEFAAGVDFLQFRGASTDR